MGDLSIGSNCRNYFEKLAEKKKEECESCLEGNFESRF